MSGDSHKRSSLLSQKSGVSMVDVIENADVANTKNIYILFIR